MKILICSTFLLFTTIISNGQETFIKKKAFETDLDSLVSIIEQVHPNPYTQFPKAKIYADIAEAKKQLADSISLLDCFTIISPLVSKIGDGHTNVLFPYSEWKSINPLLFPFNPIIDENKKLFVKKNPTSLPENAEILSINNVPSIEIIGDLLNSISGESESWRISLLQKSFTERFGAFYGFKPSYFIVFKNENFVDTLTIYGYKLGEIIQWSKKQKSINPNTKQLINKPYNFEILDKNIGLIKFKSFIEMEQFKLFLDTTFSLIKQSEIQNLIVDLRDNGGGDSMLGDELCQYISKVPFSQYGKTTTKYSLQRQQFYVENREKYLSTLNDSLFNNLFKYRPGSLILEDDTLLIQLIKNPLRFTGKVYLLTDINTFSSATSFAWCFQKFKMGKIVGEETGGYIVGFGDAIYVSLPISKLQLTISHKEFYGYGATERERHGVIPDYKINSPKALNYTIEMILEDK